MNAALRLALALALLSACSGGEPVPHGAHLIKTAGNGQTGLEGQPLAIGPSVQVTDDQGNPVSGVPVGCETTRGGGTVGTDHGLSDENGIATCGAWILGHKLGINQLQVYANGVDPVVFSAVALDTVSTFGISIQAPPTGFNGASLDVVVTTEDDNRVSSVLAAFGDRTQQLDQIDLTGRRAVFTGSIAIDGLDIGAVDALVVRATDDHFGIAETGVALTFDPAPQLIVTSPTETLSFSRPMLQLSATAIGEGDVALTATTHGHLLAQGTNILLQTVDLSAFDNQVDEIDFTAVDSFGAGTTVTRSVWVSSSPNLLPRASADGQMVDFDGARALHQSRDGRALMIADLSQRTDDPVATNGGMPAALGPNGVVMCSNVVFGGATSLVLQGAAAFVPEPCSQFDVEGNHLFYVDQSNFGWVSDLTTNILMPASGFRVAGLISLAPTGDAVFNDELNQLVHVTHDGVASVLAFDGGVRPNPVTDGTLTAYSVCDPFAGCSDVGVWDGSTESLIPLEGQPLAVWVNDGWVAWTRFVAPQGTVELWEEHWPGTAAQLAPQLSFPTVVGLIPKGALIVNSADTLWRIPAVGPAEPLLRSLGRLQVQLVQRQGHAYLLVSGLAIEVLP